MTCTIDEMVENICPGLTCQKRENKSKQVNFVNKNAGLKERSAFKPTVPPEEAETHTRPEEQGPGRTGKLCWILTPCTSACSFQNHILPIICFTVFAHCEIFFP